MNGTVCEQLGLNTLDVEPTEQNLIDYDPEEAEAWLDELRSLPR